MPSNDNKHNATSPALLPFFVYGTLRTGQGNWSRYLKGFTTSEVPARMSGVKMYSVGIAYVTDATPEDGGEQCEVVGDLMFVREEDYATVLKGVDSLEGYNPLTRSGHYIRVQRKATYIDPLSGETRQVMAWVYFGSEHALKGLSENTRVLDGDWLNRRKMFR